MTDLHIRVAHQHALLGGLALINIGVPERGPKRTTKQVERWAITEFVRVMAQHDYWDYPLCLESRDKPDFQLVTGGTRIGVEHTEVIPPQYAWALALRERENGENLIDIRLYDPDDPMIPKAEAEAWSRGKAQSLPMMGDAPERNWIRWIVHHLKVKSEKFEESAFDKFQENWLLLDDNMPSVYREEALSELVRALPKNHPFSVIYILRPRHLYRIVGSVVRTYEIRE